MGGSGRPFILSQAQENAAFGLNSKENFTGLKAASGTFRLGKGTYSPNIEDEMTKWFLIAQAFYLR